MLKPRDERLAKGMWWDRAWTLVEGCTPVSEGCEHCWAAAGSHMRACQTNPQLRARHEGLTEVGPEGARFVGKVRLMERALDLPLRTRKPTVWAVWNDLFHPDVAPAFISTAFYFMDTCRQHLFLILTKRPDRMRDVLARAGKGPLFDDCPWPLPNVGLGVPAENQRWADERIPILLSIPAAMHFVNLEPMLGAVDISQYLPVNTGDFYRDLDICTRRAQLDRLSGSKSGGVLGLDWVICGGESGPRARSMDPAWPRDVRDQCQGAGVPFFMKQMSKRQPIPSDLLIREWPSE